MKLSLLVSGSKAIYTGQFQVSGMRNKVVLSEPNYYALLDRLTQLTVEKVSPQLYTGTEVKPPVYLWILGGRFLKEGVHYQVKYQHNIEKGRAVKIVMSLVKNLTGRLETELRIVGSPHEAVKYLTGGLPDHLIGGDCGPEGNERKPCAPMGA